jgi:hypothetical protein
LEISYGLPPIYRSKGKYQMETSIAISSRTERHIMLLARKMRMAFFIVTATFFIIAAFILFRDFPNNINQDHGTEFLILDFFNWLYITVILFQFYRCTNLKEYLFQFHSIWLSLIIAFPISLVINGLIFAIKASIGFDASNLGFTAVAIWFILIFIGSQMRLRRKSEFEIEKNDNASLWKRLAKLKIIDILLLNFPKSISVKKTFTEV